MVHLVVLIHGLWGNYKHMKSLKSVIEEAVKELDEEFLFLLPRQNAMFKTFDGIELIGYRTILEIARFVKQHEGINKISIVGYSMGGLVGRFVIGKLWSELDYMFRDIEPCLFMTMATPHLGIAFYNPDQKLKGKVLHSVLRVLGSSILGKSGREMFIHNDDVLVKISEGEYLKQLARFKHRVNFANVKNDRTVAFYTSFITDVDPFIDTGNTLRYVFDERIPNPDGVLSYAPRIVDLDELSSKRKLERKANSANVAYGSWLRTAGFVTLALLIFVPIAFTMNLVATVYRYVVTAKYRKMLATGRVPEHLKRELGITDEIKDYVSSTYDEMIGETTSVSDARADEEAENEFRDDANVPWKEFIAKYKRANSSGWKTRFRRLPFDANRGRILDNLNGLDWIRVPIYVKALNAHGGIVARRGLDEQTPKSSEASVRFAAQLVKHLLA